MKPQTSDGILATSNVIKSKFDDLTQGHARVRTLFTSEWERFQEAFIYSQT